MKKVYLISNGDKQAYVAAENMNAALHLLKDEVRGVPDFDLSIDASTDSSEVGEDTTSHSIGLMEVRSVFIEKVAREKEVTVYARELSNGKTILFPVTDYADIEASIARENEEIQRVYEYSSPAYLVM